MPKAINRPISKKKRRKSRWSKGSLPDQKKIKHRKNLERSYVSSPFDQSLVDSNSNSIDAHLSHSSRSSSKASSELSVSSSFAKSSGYETLCGDAAEDTAVVNNLEENSTETKEDSILDCEKNVLLSEEEKNQEFMDGSKIVEEAEEDEKVQEFVEKMHVEENQEEKENQELKDDAKMQIEPIEDTVEKNFETEVNVLYY